MTSGERGVDNDIIIDESFTFKLLSDPQSPLVLSGGKVSSGLLLN